MQYMSEKDKIDWHKLTQKPCAEESLEENRNESFQQSIDWALLTPDKTKPESIQTNTEIDFQKKQKEQRIDWSKLTKSPKR